MKSPCLNAVIASVVLFWSHVSHAQDGPNSDSPDVTYLLNALDGQTKKHLSGVTVTISAGDIKIAGQELPEPYLGTFNYAARLKPGKYKITMSKKGYDSVAADVNITILGFAETKVLQLMRGNGQPPAGPKPGRPVAPAATKYQLQVIDTATNRKLDNARVTIAGAGRQVAAVDRKTHYEAPLGPGRYTVTVSKTGYETKRVRIDLDTNPRNWQSVQIRLARVQNVPKPPNRTVTYDLSAVDSQTKKLISGLTVSIDSGKRKIKAEELSEPYLGKYNYVARLQPGKYKVTFSKPGYDSVTADVTIGGEGLAETRTLRLTRTKVQPPAGKPLILWVKVVDDESGTSIPNPTVILFTGDARLKVSQTKDWHYAKLQPGRYTISVSKTGYASQRVTMALGAKEEDVRTIRLKRDKPPSPKAIPFAIRVIDDLDSKPLSGATVSIKAAGLRGATVAAKEQRGERVLNNYSAELAPGKYTVTVSKLGYEKQTLDANVVREGIRQVIKPIRLKRVRKPPTLVTLFVKVVDDDSGKTIPVADVAIVAGKVKQKVTSSNALYFAQLKPGEYTGTVAKSGYVTQSFNGTMGREVATRTVRLKRSKVPTPPPAVVSLQLEVVDVRGNAIRSPDVVITAVRFRLTPPELKGLHTAELKPGRYTVAVAKTGYVAQKIEVSINDVDIKRRVTLKAADSPTPTPDPPERKRSLTIVVVDTKGNEVNGATVAMVSPASTAKFIESSGSYKASGLKTGSYTATVSKSGYQTEKVVAPIGLVNGRRTVILKRIRPSEFVLRIIARDENEEPIVSFERKADAGIVVDIEQETAYVTKLKPGLYEVRFEKKGYETQIHAVTIRSSDEQLDVQLKSLKKVTKTPDDDAIPLETQPAGITFQSGKSTAGKVKAESKGGLLLRARDSDNPVTVTLGKPGGLGFTSPVDDKKTETPVVDEDNGTLTISGKTQVDRRSF